MKIVFTASLSPREAATLIAVTAATTQLSVDHGGVGGVLMVLAGIASGQLMNRGPGEPAA
jgi:hypothetical protein